MELATIALISMGAGTAMSAYGSYQQGQAQKKAADYNAQVYEANAKAAREKAAFDEAQQRRKASSLIATQRLGYGKAGVDISSGSPLDVLLQQAKDAEMDALTIRYGGDVQEATNLNQASMSSWQGRQAATAGTIGMGATLLQGAGSMFDAYGKQKLYKVK